MPTKIHPDVTPPKAPKYGASKTVTFFSLKIPYTVKLPYLPDIPKMQSDYAENKK